MDFKQTPTDAWIEEVRARFPTETTVDEALTRKLRSRAGPAYAPSPLSDIEDRLRAFLAQEEPGAEVSGVLPLGGGASKEQYRFDLSRDGVSRTYVLRREPPESIVETHRLREYQLMRAVAGVVPVPEVPWVDPAGRWFGRPSLISRFVSGVTKPPSASAIGPAKSSFQARRPCFLCASSSMRSTPGTPTERPLATASGKERGAPCSSRSSRGVAPRGATSRPS